MTPAQAEIKRLHSVCRDDNREIDRLRAINAYMLAALQDNIAVIQLASFTFGVMHRHDSAKVLRQAVEQMKAAIARATREG